MKFWEAMKAAEEGKKVRNKRWVTGCYIFKEGERYFTADGNPFCDFVRSTDGEWEIYEAKKEVDPKFKAMYKYLKDEYGFVNDQYTEYMNDHNQPDYLLKFYQQLLDMAKYYKLDEDDIPGSEYVGDAIKYLRQGMKIRKPDWDSGNYIYLSDNDKIMWGSGLVYTGDTSISDIWVTYSETDTETKAEEKHTEFDNYVPWQERYESYTDGNL